MPIIMHSRQMYQKYIKEPTMGFCYGFLSGILYDGMTDTLQSYNFLFCGGVKVPVPQGFSASPDGP